MFVWYESSERSMLQCIYISSYNVCSPIPSICQLTAEQQSLHMSGFLHVIYAMPNASVILEGNEIHLERNEKRLERNEKRVERNDTHLTRNKTRGGNLLLSGTVKQTTTVANYLPATHTRINSTSAREPTLLAPVSKKQSKQYLTFISEIKTFDIVLNTWLQKKWCAQNLTLLFYSLPITDCFLLFKIIKILKFKVYTTFVVLVFLGHGQNKKGGKKFIS